MTGLSHLGRGRGHGCGVTEMEGRTEREVAVWLLWSHRGVGRAWRCALPLYCPTLSHVAVVHEFPPDLHTVHELRWAPWDRHMKALRGGATVRTHRAIIGV